MHSNFLLNIQGLLLAAILFSVAAPVEAQRTGDHIPPSRETVCDNDPFNFGLCNTYCEALDCDSDTPLGAPRACANALQNYLRKSDGELPPCEQTCPCDFEADGDFADLVIFANAEFGIPLDVEGTYDEFCDDWGPNGENTFVASALQFEPTEFLDPLGIVLAYWLEEETGETPASCNEFGLGFDGINNYGLNDDYGPWIDRKTSLSGTETVVCRDLLAKLCPAE